MGTIQPKNVDSGFDHLWNHIFCPTVRTQGGHNLHNIYIYICTHIYTLFHITYMHILEILKSEESEITKEDIIYVLLPLFCVACPRVRRVCWHEKLEYCFQPTTEALHCVVVPNTEEMV